MLHLGFPSVLGMILQALYQTLASFGAVLSNQGCTLDSFVEILPKRLNSPCGITCHTSDKCPVVRECIPDLTGVHLQFIGSVYAVDAECGLHSFCSKPSQKTRRQVSVHCELSKEGDWIHRPSLWVRT